MVVRLESVSVRDGRARLLEAVHISKDQTSFLVLLEDSAAPLGLAVAFLGVSSGEVG